MTKNVQQWVRGTLLAGTVLIGVGGCGGSGDPLDNPPTVTEASGGAGQSLSFAYFQQCVNPIFLAALPNPLNNGATTNTCSSAGCHDDATGRGAAFRIVPTATPVPTSGGSANFTQTEAQIETTDMYKNFLSTQGMVIVGNPAESLLINKPLTRGVLHGGGLIFANDQDPNIKQMEFWISNPLPAGEDEFGASASSLFVNGTACQSE